jgi:hypothetical protein
MATAHPALPDHDTAARALPAHLPGAFDCASCSATVLETLRAIKAGPPLKNDVIFLFTDGEEVHTTGAQAFAQKHPWARDVALTLVYEGYASSGADILYATGADSGWLTGQALATGAHLTGYSFMNTILGALGGSGSDLETLLSDGKPGLAFITFSLATVPAYHTWADNVAKLDPRTLQSHGDNAVALVRRLGNLSLTGVPRQPNAVYFPLAPGLAVHYPSAAALPLAILALMLFIVVLALGLRRRRRPAGQFQPLDQRLDGRLVSGAAGHGARAGYSAWRPGGAR